MTATVADQREVYGIKTTRLNRIKIEYATLPVVEQVEVVTVAAVAVVEADQLFEGKIIASMNGKAMRKTTVEGFKVISFEENELNFVTTDNQWLDATELTTAQTESFLTEII